MNFINKIQSKIHKDDGGLKIDNPDALVDVHHIFMKEYGWIPIKEFEELTLPQIWNLLNCIKKEKEREKKEMDKAKRKR